jgi:O-antigen ligase
VIAALLVYKLIQGVVPRLVLMVGVPVLLLTLALTLSRTGLIVLVITILSVWYRLARERGFMVLLGSTLACLALVVVLPGEFWQRAGTILPSIEGQEDTFGIRVRLWMIGARIIEDNPFLGVGPGNFIHASNRYAAAGVSGYRLNAHNTYVGTAAETGLVGLALLLAVIVSAMVGARRVVRAARQAGRSDLALAGVTVETMMLALMLSGLTGNIEGTKILWIGLGMCVAFVGVARKSLAEETPPDESRAVPAEAVREVGTV